MILYTYIYLGSVLTTAFGYQITHIIRVEDNINNNKFITNNNNNIRQPSRHFDCTIHVKELDRFGNLHDENVYDVDLPNYTIVLKKKVVWHHKCYWEGKIMMIKLWM